MSKHMTRAEREARKAAEKALERDSRVYLKMPDWLSDDAKQIFTEIRRKQRGIKLLDNLDAELLAVYCDSVAKYRAMSQDLSNPENKDNPNALDVKIKQLQAWARIISAYAEKLGLSPASRARLAKKKAEPEPIDELEKLLDEML
jgi:P27 family predicted phage terminase small subunit